MRFLIAVSFAFLLTGILPACAKHSVSESPTEHDQSYKPSFEIPQEGISFHAIPAGEYELKSIRYFSESREGKKPKTVVSLNHELALPGERDTDEIHQLHLEMGDTKEDRMLSNLDAMPKIFSDGTTSITKQQDVFTYNLFPDGKTEVAVSGSAGEIDAIKTITDALPLSDKGVYFSERTDVGPNGEVLRELDKIVVKLEGDTVVIYQMRNYQVDGETDRYKVVMSASTYIRKP
jgi:hypothetical protein